jgi:hypothetical protein
VASLAACRTLVFFLGCSAARGSPFFPLSPRGFSLEEVSEDESEAANNWNVRSDL